jgi:GNAT superfamily N-acetyltransferase
MEGLELVWDEGSGGAFVVRAFLGGLVVGQARGQWSGEDCCELERVEVLEAWRRRGIGRSLVREVQARAYRITACSICEPGAQLLAHCGFVADEGPGARWSWCQDPIGVGDRDF